MKGDDVVGDREAEPGPPVVLGPGAIEPREPLEDPLPLVGRDTGAVVGHAEHRGRVRLVQRDGHGRGGVTGGVVEQVAHDAYELGTVRDDLGAGDAVGVDVDGMSGSEPSRFGEDDVVEVDELAVRRVVADGVDGDARASRSSTRRWSRTVSSSTSRSVACQSACSGCARSTSSWARIPVSGLRSSWLASATNRRWRVGGVLEPAEHRVHGAGEPADLVVGRRLRHPAVEVLGPDGLDLARGSPPPGAARAR